MRLKPATSNRAPRLEAMLSKAIETNKQRELTYVRQATIDALTGCKNRRAFDSDIAALMNDHQPFALALVDIDNFKSINDTWGHLNGDIVLRNVAREGLQVLQPLEISLYRYGGEEFAVVFPAEHIDNAPHAAGNMAGKRRTAHLARRWPDGHLQRRAGGMEHGAAG